MYHGTQFCYYKVMKRIVVAYDQKHGIGAKNDIMWLPNLPADMKHFREVTTGSTIIMGRNTYNSIGRPLPNRHNIVISRTPDFIEGVTVVTNLDDAYSAAETDDINVIGGGQIYDLAFDTVDEIIATEVQETFPQAEVFFPEIHDSEWQEISREHHEPNEKNKYAYDFVTYRKLEK